MSFMVMGKFHNAILSGTLKREWGEGETRERDRQREGEIDRVGVYVKKREEWRLNQSINQSIQFIYQENIAKIRRKSNQQKLQIGIFPVGNTN